MARSWTTVRATVRDVNASQGAGPNKQAATWAQRRKLFTLMYSFKLDDNDFGSATVIRQ